MSSPRQLNVAFIGAGGIHFGEAGSPWDHASRLETMPGISVQAIVDPHTDRANSVLETRRSGQRPAVYQGCTVYASVDELLSDSRMKIDVAMMGSPPYTRGCKEKDLELKLLEAGIHCFIEKPLSVASPEEVNAYAGMLNAAAKKHNLVTSVGYMFRYHAAVRKMKELITAHGGKVMSFNGRYYLAYANKPKGYWWDCSLGGGPIADNGTHFCDIARYLCGDVVPETIQAIRLRKDDPSGAGQLSAFEVQCEEGVPDARRPPRVATAIWQHTDGAVGSLMFVMALHDKRYETCIDVLMDGLRMTLHEPYDNQCALRVRKSGSDQDEIFPFGDDDPYGTELEVFIEAVRTGDCSGVQSPYSDAAKTYSFTWDIQKAAAEKY